MREIDVKARTNELTSMFHAWREGMKEWKRVYEIEELKKVIMEGKTELSLDDYVKKLAKKED